MMTTSNVCDGDDSDDDDDDKSLTADNEKAVLKHCDWNRYVIKSE